MADKDVFILGAGFSKAISPRMPTMNELTDEVRWRIENSELSLPVPLMDSEDRGLDTFTYFKLHGSVNWLYSGRENFFGETIFYSDVSPWGSCIADFERDSRLSAEDKQSLIIPPVTEKTTYFNNETVRRFVDAYPDLCSGYGPIG